MGEFGSNFAGEMTAFCGYVNWSGMLAVKTHFSIMDVKPVGPQWQVTDIGTQRRNPLLHYVKFNQKLDETVLQTRRNKFLIVHLK